MGMEVITFIYIYIYRLYRSAFIFTVYMCVCAIGVSCSSDNASYHVRIISWTIISNRFKPPGRDDSAQLLMVYEEVYGVEAQDPHLLSRFM